MNGDRRVCIRKIAIASRKLRSSIVDYLFVASRRLFVVDFFVFYSHARTGENDSHASTVNARRIALKIERAMLAR